MTRRVLLNLVVFALFGAVLAIWAVRDVLHFDPWDQPYGITAQFTASPGLQPNFDVTYLGVAVGKIKSVRLKDGIVVVELAIDRGKQIPNSVHAMAGPKSAIGEPFVDLEPPAGKGGAPALRPGDTIPLARTSVARTYGDLFASVNKSVNGLDPDALGTVTQELALGLDGRGDSLRQAVDGASQLVGTFADNTETLDALITNVSTLTRILADHRSGLGSGISSTAQLTGSLAAVDDSLRTLRDRSPGLLSKTARLLERSSPALKCTLSALADGLPVLLSDKNVADLSLGMRWAPQLAPAMRGVITYVDGDPNLNLTITLTPGPVKGALEYKDPLLLPAIPKIATCDGIPLPSQQSPPLSTQKPSAAKEQPTTAAGPGTSTVPISQRASERHDGPMSWLIYLPPLVAGLILLRVALNTFGFAIRRPGRKRSRK